MFDLGIYGGGAYSTSWFKSPDADGEGFKTGFSPIFGLQATYWFTPTVGVRAHGAYMPSKIPQGEVDLGDDWVVNNYFYDLNLAFRPWIMNADASDWLASTYFFLGGGGLTSNTAGDGIGLTNCAVIYPGGACLPADPSLGTVGQGVVGVGMDWVALSSSLSLFS